MEGTTEPSKNVVGSSVRATAGDYWFAVFALAVVAYNNLSLLWKAAIPAQQPLVDAVSLLVWGVVLWRTVGVEKLSLADLGFRRLNLGTSVAWGVLAGGVMAAPALLFFLFPVILPGPVQHSTYASLSVNSVPLALAFLLLLGIGALSEEFLFRGLIQVRGARWLGPSGGIALSCALFVFWHVVVTYQGLQHTNLAAASVPLPVIYVAAAVPLAIAGIVFSLLRQRTGSLAGPVVAHTLVNTLMHGSLFLLGSGAIMR